jgi:hypothetical protein
MELLADQDPEDVRKLLDPVLERMMDAVHRYEGTINQVMGDGIMRFSVHQLRMRTTPSAPATQPSRCKTRWGGIPTSFDARRVSKYRFASASIQVGFSCARSAVTYAWTTRRSGRRPTSHHAWFEAAAGRGLSRFVGRDREMEQLRGALGKAARGLGQVVAVVGEPGVGKSRLFYEFVHSVRTRGWSLMESGSDSYGSAILHLPIIGLLKYYFRIQDRDEPRDIREKVTGRLITLDEELRPLLPVFLALLNVQVDDPDWEALDAPRRRLRTLSVVTKLLIRESQVQPVCMVVEDLHWIDAETQEVLNSLVGSLPTKATAGRRCTCPSNLACAHSWRTAISV